MNRLGTQGPAARVRDSHGMPLSLAIARYLAYVLVLTVVLAAAAWVAFGLLVESGVVYAAYTANRQVDSLVTQLEAGDATPADIPSCFRWAVFDAQGNALSRDMDEGDLAEAWSVTVAGADVARYDGLGGVVQQEAAVLSDGQTCVLQYDYLPDFTSRAMRDALPDPQTLLLGAFFVLFVLMVALIAVRASRVITRKMQPLVQATCHIEQHELDFAVGTSNVREVNDVLAAMERMRSALSESLHARWEADEARRNQVSALAHDLKTPLSVARWNTDLLRESPLDEDQAACAEGLSDSLQRMDGYVRLLVETSQLDVLPAALEQVDVAALAAEVGRQARPLCEANGLVWDLSCSASGTLQGNEEQLVRAMVNLVSNAVDHAPAASRVTVRFSERDGAVLMEVEDEGPGFSPAALAHGKERFFTDSADRNAASGHYGLGLSIVNDIAVAHGGAFTLTNRASGGARGTIEVPRG